MLIFIKQIFVIYHNAMINSCVMQ